MSQSTYAPGHHPAVTSNHTIRTATHDASFLLPYLKPSHHILDVGCGPGTITSGFAAHVPQGSVTGIDLSPDVISQARSLADGVPNVIFQKGDVVAGLNFDAETFDVVFCNQVLPYISDPTQALREMRRVCKKDGIVACREGDTPFHFYPELPGLFVLHKYLWMLIHGPLPAEGEFDTGRPYNAPHPPNHRAGSRIHVWAREAGFEPEKIVKDASVQIIATQEKRKFLAGVMVRRIEDAGQRGKFMDLGATEDDVDGMVRDLKAWRDDVDGWYSIMNCEVVCSK
jgi:ubiquinone/menaquinone biosynthesis C-methylase UbiE